MKSKDTISVTVMSPETIVWQGEVVSLSSANTEGTFDILPDHARFMSLIEKTPMTFYLPDASEKIIPLEKAVLFFQDNSAKIYIHKVQ